MRHRIVCMVCVPGERTVIGFAPSQDEAARDVSAHQREAHWPSGYGPFDVPGWDAGRTDCVVGYAEPVT